ncbi:MAG: hypothetical protein A2W09_05600 [Deltaproteobacteria bacterium RBG_16_50_11]|nr:MAG: hypothetical protein A2W09_05600 [Deltaproteobacteria bacterium RBG_16_50_11]
MKNLTKFVYDFWAYALRGGPKLYIWLGFLSFFIFLMLFGTYLQLRYGMIVTNYNDQVSWGLYEAQFIFLVGVAAASVTVVFPAYIYNHKACKEIVVIGEMLAISAVVMVMLFIVAHMGRPDRSWHMMPVVGIFNWPASMLTWDVVAINGYLALNVIAVFYYLYKKYTGSPLNMKFYMPLVYLSIAWAVSIHTVTAFLINTLPARPMWFHALMPAKFITTAFAAGPSMIIVVFLIMRKTTRLKAADQAVDLLAQIVTWCLGIAIFMGISEVVTEFYPATEHSSSLQYLIFGKEGFHSLVIWYWSSVVMMVSAFFILLIPRLRKHHGFWLPFACVLTFAGIWIDKGMGLVVPAFVPTPIGEFSEYTPSAIEIINTLGYWAFGLFLFTVLTKGSMGVLLGDISLKEPSYSFFAGRVKAADAMKKSTVALMIIGLSAALFAPASYAASNKKSVEEPLDCFESREVYSTRHRTEMPSGLDDIRCSKTTGAVLWFGDPFSSTEPLGDMPVEGAYTYEEAVVKPRTKQLKYFMPCTACHNGVMVPYPANKKPRVLSVHTDIVPDSMSLQHGRGAFWCLDCHNAKDRDKLIGHRGESISFNQPQRLCGKCHGEVYGDWRAGIHGKRIGNWTEGGMKRWWVCTECHNPHMVQLKRFEPIKPEPAPALPRTRTKADYENLHK